jgi:alpha-glucoside transport system permease protein
VLTDAGLGRALANSLLIAVPATVGTVSVGAVTAYTLARQRFAGRGALQLVLLALLVLPAQLTLVPLLRLYGGLHLTGTFPGIWLVHMGLALPFAVYLLRTFFAALPAELFEAAELDGASPLAAFVRVALPTSLPAIASLAIFDFVWIWNDLLLALVFLGGDKDVAPLTVAVSNLVSATTGQGQELLAPAAFVSMSLPLLLFFGLQRYFVRGLLAGAVK